jgi:hypothetical protein
MQLRRNVEPKETIRGVTSLMMDAFIQAQQNKAPVSIVNFITNKFHMKNIENDQVIISRSKLEKMESGYQNLKGKITSFEEGSGFGVIERRCTSVHGYHSVKITGREDAIKAIEAVVLKIEEREIMFYKNRIDVLILDKLNLQEKLDYYNIPWYKRILKKKP